MTTRRELILQALYALAATVPGIAQDSLTRERATAVNESDCPTLDLAPESDPEPTPFGGGLDLHELTVTWKLCTAGNGAYALADPIVQDLHKAIFAAAPLGELVMQILPGPTDFARDDADQTIGRTTVRYRLQYLTRRSDIALA